MGDFSKLSEGQLRQVLVEMGLPSDPALAFRPAPPGFSTAQVFQVQAANSRWALRVTAAAVVPPDLARRHAWLDQLAGQGLTFIPTVVRSTRGGSWVHHAGLLLELFRWQPGSAGWDLERYPGRWQAAAESIGRFHRQSALLHGEARGLSPGIVRRLQRLQAESLQNVEQTYAAIKEVTSPELKPLLTAAVARLQLLRPPALARLRPWVQRPVRLQMIHGDLWEDHLLFEEDRVSGLIDFANSRFDHPAWDWARLVESSGPRLADHGRWIGACQAAAGQHHSEDDELLETLLATAPAAGLETWLRWLLLERRHLATDARVVPRLRALLQSTK